MKINERIIKHAVFFKLRVLLLSHSHTEIRDIFQTFDGFIKDWFPTFFVTLFEGSYGTCNHTELLAKRFCV